MSVIIRNIVESVKMQDVRDFMKDKGFIYHEYLREFIYSCS
jgi:hypothetical protein